MTGSLTQTLEAERDHLDHLRFRLVETRLLLVVGELSYLAVAAQEVDEARQQVRATDLVRATTLARMERTGTGHELLTLRQVAAGAGPSEAPLLRDHHEGLCRLVAEIEVTAHRTAELARACIHRLALADAGLEEAAEPPEITGRPHATDTSTLPRTGPRTGPEGRPRLTLPPSAGEADPLAHERALQDTIAVAGRLRMPALLAFLR